MKWSSLVHVRVANTTHSLCLAIRNEPHRPMHHHNIKINLNFSNLLRQISLCLKSDMRENFNLQIKGAKVTLVPYRHKFVEKYHEWMKDPNTLEMTASEPLSIEEEYKMQKSWREDSNKCTFIVLSTEELLLSSVASDPELVAMAGDVNMFFNDYEDKHVAEMEVMIAEPRFRQKGFARESVQLMMDYAVKHHQIHRLYVKINQANEASIHLFKTLGYVEVNYVPAFEEYEFEFRVEPEQMEQEEVVGVNRKRVQEGGAHAVYCEYLEPDVE